MAAITYYWVGGAGTWDNTSATNWAASSGGAGGAGVPDYLDYVIFNSASNAVTYQVTIGTTAAARDVTAAGPLTGTLTFAFGTTGAIRMFGQWQNNATNVAFTGSGSINWQTSISCGIDTNGVSLASIAITFYDIFLAAADLTLISNLTTLGSITIDSGVFNTNGKTLSCNTLNSTGSLTRTITLGASAITFTGTATVVNFLAATNLTFNAGTSTITCSGTNAALRASGQTFYIVNFTSVAQGGTTIQGSNTFTNLTQSSRNVSGQRLFIVDGNNTITGTLTLQTIGTPNPTIRTVVQSDVIGTQRTLTAAAVSGLADVDFRDIAAAGAASWTTGTRIGNLLNNSGITFTTGVNKYWNLAAGGIWSSTAWATSPGGAVAAANFPLAQDTANIDLTTITSGSTITFSLQYQIPTVICTRPSGSNTLTIACTATESMCGNWTSCSGLTFTGTGAWSFVGQGLTQTITSNSIPFSQSFIVNSFGGTVSLQDAFTTSSTSTLTLTSGTLDLNNFTLTTGLFSSSNSNTRVLAFGTSKIVVTGTNTSVYNTSVATGLTITGSRTVEFTGVGTGGQIRTITGGVTTTGGTAATAVDCYIQAGADAIDFGTANRTYRTINFTGFGSGAIAANTRPNIYGDFVLSATMTVTVGTNNWAFAATTAQTITTNSVTINNPITFNGTGSWAFQDALSMPSKTLTMTNGTLQLKSGTTSTVGSLVTTGTGQKYLLSTTPGTQATISAASGTNSVSYLTIQDSNATGGAAWDANAATNVDAGNNTGWDFGVTPAISNEITMRLRSFTQPRRF